MPGLGLVRVWQGNSSVHPSTQLETCFTRGFAGLLTGDGFLFLVSNLSPALGTLPAAFRGISFSPYIGSWARTGPQVCLPCPAHPWSRDKSSTVGTCHIPGQGSPEVTPVPRYSVRLEPIIFNDFSFLHTTLFIFHFPNHSCWALLTRREKKKHI